MTPERWTQIEELFHRAAECDPEKRASLLDQECVHDMELRREVEALLACEPRASDHMQSAVQTALENIEFPLIGQTVSHYRILDGLGGGGMGLVYRAEDLKLGRQVALKFLPEEMAMDSAALGRFEREARSASALEHPNICPIHEFGDHEGQPFLVMQLLEGQTLRQCISNAPPGKPPFSLEQLLQLSIQIIDGLDAAHKKGIMHRDIKPANIFVTKLGQAKILDFGLAKLASANDPAGDTLESQLQERNSIAPASGDPPGTTLDPFLSCTGVAMGTAGYMSPEQARGEKLDPRTDLFSFGLVLHEMATGQRPFKSDTRPLLYDTILEETPALVTQWNAKLPVRLAKIIQKALEEDKEVRYQTAADLRTDLHDLKEEIERQPPVLRWLAVSGGLVVLLIILTMFWLTRNHPATQEKLPDIKLKQLTVNSPENRVIGGFISPNGKYLAYSDSKGMHIKSIEENRVWGVSSPETSANEKVIWDIASWFPDSASFLANSHPARESQIGWSSQTSNIWVVPLQGSALRKVREHAVAWSVSVDGSSIAFGANKGDLGEREIWLMQSDGTRARKLYEVSGKQAICCLSFLPDGRRVSYISGDASGDALLTRNLDDSSAIILRTPSEMKNMGDGLWLPDGSFLYSDPCTALIRSDSACNFWIERRDERSGKLIGKPRLLTNWFGAALNNPSVSGEGKSVAFLQSRPYLTSYVGDLGVGGSPLHHLRHFPLTETLNGICDWTHDSKQVILVSSYNDQFGIYKQSLSQDIAEPIVTQGYGRNARVTPDGQSILYLGPTENGESIGSGGQPVKRVPIGGGTPQSLFMARPASIISCARSPVGSCAIAEPREDRKELVFTTLDPSKGRGSEILSLAIDPKENDWYFDLIPDGSRIAIIRSSAGPIEVFSAHGEPISQIQLKGWTNVLALTWAADGKGLFVVVGAENKHVLLYADLHGDARVLWENSAPTAETIPTPSPDGRHLAISTWSESSNIWLMQNF